MVKTRRRTSKRRTFFTVRVTQGTGSRVSRGRFKTRTQAKSAISKLNSRVNADTKNPRIKKFKGFK